MGHFKQYDQGPTSCTVEQAHKQRTIVSTSKE